MSDNFRVSVSNETENGARSDCEAPFQLVTTTKIKKGAEVPVPSAPSIFSKRCTTSGTGTMRWLKYTVERIPIPQISEEQEKEIVDLYHEYEKTSNKEILSKINYRFYQFIGLDEEDIKVVEGSA